MSLHFNLHRVSWTPILSSLLSWNPDSQYFRALTTAFVRALRLADWQRLFHFVRNSGYAYLAPSLLLAGLDRYVHELFELAFDQAPYLVQGPFLLLTTAFTASALLITIFTWLLSPCRRRRSRSPLAAASDAENHTIAADALRALQTVIIPSQNSHWPPHYTALAQLSHCYCRDSNKKAIMIPLSTLVHDYMSGCIELRNAREHLPVFLYQAVVTGFCNTEGITVQDGWTVGVDVDRGFWSEVGWEVMWKGAWDGWGFDMGAFLENVEAFSLTVPTYDLDHVPYTKLNNFLSRLRRQVLAYNGDGTVHKLTLELTIRNRNPTLSSTDITPHSSAYSVLAFPFVSPKSHKSTLPLDMTLSDLVERLETHGFGIISVVDVSTERCEGLWCEAEKMEMDRVGLGARDAEGEEVVEGRECELKKLWEASLLDGGLLGRWRVVVVV